MSQQEHLARIRSQADELARSLVAASDDGVGHGVIVPQLIMAFRAAFGSDPSPETMRMIAAAGAAQ